MNRHTLLHTCIAAVSVAFALPAFAASSQKVAVAHRAQPPRACSGLVGSTPDDENTVRPAPVEVARSIDAAAKAAFVSVLFDAVKAGNAASVTALVDLDRSVLTARDGGGRTLLHWAARNGRLAVLALLVEKGADVNAADRGGVTALHSLASQGNIEGLRVLLDRGADPDVATAEGSTAVQLAARAGQADAVRFLTMRRPGGSGRTFIRMPS